jgi:CheY-like chemotaxis protein/signal transduction histidine kinase
MGGEQQIEELGENVLRFLAEYLGAQVGAFFTRSDAGFQRVAAYGLPASAGIADAFQPGQGLLGQAVRDRRAFLISDVPEGYLRIGSALGSAPPRRLLIAPVQADKLVNGVIELGFFQPIADSAQELLQRVGESIGVAVRSANYRTHLQDLLAETQRQAEELETQSEELRVANEELEEQSRALKESQSRLEMQQVELEQTNAQLEEQAGLLESQRDHLAKAGAELATKAQELERASQYKSDFLANMSHELRTPLNSSLILAKLLAENREGNLTDDQVQSAETIHAAGCDLLNLINDILDLSKIEAGRMEIRPEEVSLARVVEDLTQTFRPIAEQKHLLLQFSVAPDCPESLETDRQRLEQVLKNLLSNALKFTEKGQVSLRVERQEGNRIAFAVSDTGIGIPADQQGLIFDAFRQVDGASNRKYGGTGLGLSITREFTRLLGGEIQLSSTVGKGSTFTVRLPEAFAGASPAGNGGAGNASASQPSVAHAPVMQPAQPPLIESRPPQSPPASSAQRQMHSIPDDRGRLKAGERVILIVEDDLKFARVLYDLGHELHFQCLLAATAEEALAVAREYLPSAIVLDIGLPDHSGLSVLERLKHDSRTRHIPVHIVSGDDHTETALALGAVGYMLKPVSREALAEALQGLEKRLVRRVRHVLVVEDDEVQRQSVQKLLGSQDVETVGVGSAAQCLEQLKNASFDCMVLDLSLPDASGYSLLETLSQEEAYSFPPVIVYTGRDLTAEDEQKLRRYSKSIIIKGAKSPERLLDEVSLFLHQVVSELPVEQQRMIQKARSRDAALEGRRILVVEDDVRNIFALTSIFEPRGANIEIARNGREALEALEAAGDDPARQIDLVLMDIMMPEMDGLTATREIRKRSQWSKLPVIALTAKAMKEDQENCLTAGANDYMAKPLDIDRLLSLVRVWMPK